MSAFVKKSTIEEIQNMFQYLPQTMENFDVQKVGFGSNSRLFIRYLGGKKQKVINEITVAAPDSSTGDKQNSDLIWNSDTNSLGELIYETLNGQGKIVFKAGSYVFDLTKDKWLGSGSPSRSSDIYPVNIEIYFESPNSSNLSISSALTLRNGLYIIRGFPEITTSDTLFFGKDCSIKLGGSIYCKLNISQCNLSVSGGIGGESEILGSNVTLNSQSSVLSANVLFKGCNINALSNNNGGVVFGGVTHITSFTNCIINIQSNNISGVTTFIESEFNLINSVLNISADVQLFKTITADVNSKINVYGKISVESGVTVFAGLSYVSIYGELSGGSGGTPSIGVASMFEIFGTVDTSNFNFIGVTQKAILHVGSITNIDNAILHLDDYPNVVSFQLAKSGNMYDNTSNKLARVNRGLITSIVNLS